MTAWNEWHKPIWFATSDVLDSAVVAPEGFRVPPVAIWSNKIYRLDKKNPGTSGKINLVASDTPGKKFLPLQLLGGLVVSYCEKKRDAKLFGTEMQDGNPGIDPKDFGVRLTTAPATSTGLVRLYRRLLHSHGSEASFRQCHQGIRLLERRRPTLERDDLWDNGDTWDPTWVS